jgi:hypothetical protein
VFERTLRLAEQLVKQSVLSGTAVHRILPQAPA